MKHASCIKCGAPLAAPSTPGRPPAYCGTGCRRAAEREITRLNDRLALLESRAMGDRLGWGLPSAGATQKIEAEIRRTEARLAELLDAAPE